MAAILPQIPVEILIIIISYAADGDTNIAAKLCRVCSWVRDVVQPILYRVISLNLSPLDAETRLQQHQVRHYVRELGLIGVTNFRGLKELVEHPLQNVHNFATDSVYNLGLVSTESVEELHLLNIVAYRPLTAVALPKLKKLHYCGRRGPLLGSATLSMPGLLQGTALTHLAVSVPEESNMTGFVSEIKRILKHCHTLQLVFIRILYSTALVLQGAEYESLEGQLAVIGDPRLVTKRVDAVANAEVLLREWERNARERGGFWDWAEHQLKQRSSMRNSFR